MPAKVTKKTKGHSSKEQSAKRPDHVGRYSVPVVRSTFGILQVLSRAQDLTLNEITRHTGISKSTVFRILNTLQEMGYVMRDEVRGYRITPALGRLADQEASSETVRRMALPLMLDLRDRYGETVNLGVRTFDKVTYLEVVPSEFALRLEERRGASVPAHASALGKAILAFTSQDAVQDLVQGRPLEIVTRNTISNPIEFLAELKRVRSAGLAFDRGEGSVLAVCIGAPILDAQGNAMAAMSISGPASRFNPRKDSPVVASLLKATAELSSRLARI